MREKKTISDEEKYYVASQWQLMWRKFKKHKLAIIGISILAIFYTVALFCEFFSTHGMHKRYPKYIYCPPQRIHFFDDRGFHFRPFVYGFKWTMEPKSFRRIYTENKAKKHFIYFFIHGEKYKLWNSFETDIHLFGVRKGTLFLFGTDKLGRDLFSRNLYAARISLSIGLVGVAVSFVLGCILGGISGFYGGTVDMIIQRVVEFLMSIPTIPLWMALSAALPPNWSPIKVYFGISIILALRGWTGLARVVRGKILELREEDFTMAAKVAGSTDRRIITRHLLPSFLSYLIVNLTLAIPHMILGETSPWLLIPGLFVIIVVLSFNFLGDGLRDAADPYK